MNVLERQRDMNNQGRAALAKKNMPYDLCRPSSNLIVRGGMSTDSIASSLHLARVRNFWAIWGIIMRTKANEKKKQQNNVMGMRFPQV